MDRKTEQKACRMYYLDGQSIQAIAKELRITREAVRDAVDDPKAQADYLAMAEQVRKRLRVRQGFAAEAALERQLQILQAEPASETEKQLQMVTAERILKRSEAAERRDAVSGQKTIVFRVDGIKLGMPPADSAAGRTAEARPDDDPCKGLRMNK